MEEQYIQQRREKLDRLRRLGVEVYARRFDYTHSIKEIVDELQDTTTEELEGIHRRERVCGRIIAVRGPSADSSSVAEFTSTTLTPRVRMAWS